MTYKKNSCVCVCVCSHHYNRKGERIGLIVPCASSLILSKGGQRLSDISQRLSDSAIGGDS